MQNVMLSVLMAAHNAEKYIFETIESVLMQTYDDFEFIIIDDASTDSTNSIIRQFDDKRVKLLENTKNLGLTKSLNIGLKVAKGKYIVRTDADDINITDRFEKQVEYMESNPQIMLSSCSMIIFDGNIEKPRILDFDNSQIKARLLFNSVLLHPGFIFKREICAEDGYDETYRYAQDYEFQARMSQKYAISCIKDIGVRYRVSESQISTKKYIEQQECANRVRRRMFLHYGIALNDNRLKCVQLLSTGRIKEMTCVQFLVASKIMFELKLKVKKSGCPEGKAICDLCDEMNYKMRNEIFERVKYVLKRD